MEGVRGGGHASRAKVEAGGQHHPRVNRMKGSLQSLNLGAFFASKRCWVPTSIGWLLVMAVGLGIMLEIRAAFPRFLSPTEQVSSEVLLVEGWLPDYAMRGAVREFRRGKYKRVVTCGFTFDATWLKDRFKTSAEFAAANLTAMGLPANVVFAAPAAPTARDRTYASALAVRRWLEASAPHNIRLTSAKTSSGKVQVGVTVYSLGAHARRTRLLFQKALGTNYQVGVIAHPNETYDPHRWWASSNGFVDVSGEALAYLYAKFLFYPGTPPVLVDSGGQQLVQ